MDNSNYLDCEIVPENDICVEVDNTNVISREYSGVDTEDIDITVDNRNYTISAGLSDERKEQLDNIPRNTSDLTNDGDGESPFATEAYVGAHGGKIDSISVNNTPQTIDANKNVNITVPTQASDVHALADSTKYGASLGVSGTTVQLKDQDGNNLGSSITTQDTGATSVETTGAGNAVTSASYDSSTRKITLTKGTEFQTATDNSLNTNAKTVSGAINEVNTVAKNANIAKGFTNYQSLITELNSASSTAYKVGQSFYIQTKDVPDLWVISIESESSTYTYVDDATFVTATAVSGGQQVGYYKLGQLETQKVDLTNYVQKTFTIAGIDLQDNITKSELQTALNVEDGAEVNTVESISAGGTALTPDANRNVNIPVGQNGAYSSTNKGVISVCSFSGLSLGGIDINGGHLWCNSTTDNAISTREKVGNIIPRILTNDKINNIVKAGLSDSNHLTMTAAEQATAQSVLGIQFGITRLG